VSVGEKTPSDAENGEKNDLEKNLSKFSDALTGYAEMYNILCKPRTERLGSEQEQIVSVISELPFFKERFMTESELLDIANVITLLPKEAGETVMEYGDVGEHFYFVLMG